MKYVGKLSIQAFTWARDLFVTEDVIITDERIEHIEKRHPGDYALIEPYLSEALRLPDYILEDNGKFNSCLILKKINNGSLRFQIVLRIATSYDNPEYKNSIISAWRVNESRWKNYIKNKKSLYKGGT